MEGSALTSTTTYCVCLSRGYCHSTRRRSALIMRLRRTCRLVRLRSPGEGQSGNGSRPGGRQPERRSPTGLAVCPPNGSMAHARTRNGCSAGATSGQTAGDVGGHAPGS